MGKPLVAKLRKTCNGRQAACPPRTHPALDSHQFAASNQSHRPHWQFFASRYKKKRSTLEIFRNDVVRKQETALKENRNKKIGSSPPCWPFSFARDLPLIRQLRLHRCIQHGSSRSGNKACCTLPREHVHYFCNQFQTLVSFFRCSCTQSTLCAEFTVASAASKNNFSRFLHQVAVVAQGCTSGDDIALQHVSEQIQWDSYKWFTTYSTEFAWNKRQLVLYSS